MERRGEMRKMEEAASSSHEAKKFKEAERRGVTRLAGDAQLPDREDLEAEMGIITQCLLELGGLEGSEVDVSEIFSPGRFAEVASAFQLIPGTAFDLRIGWDLSTAAGREWRERRNGRTEME